MLHFLNSFVFFPSPANVFNVWTLHAFYYQNDSHSWLDYRFINSCFATNTFLSPHDPTVTSGALIRAFYVFMALVQAL